MGSSSSFSILGNSLSIIYVLVAWMLNIMYNKIILACSLISWCNIYYILNFFQLVTHSKLLTCIIISVQYWYHIYHNNMHFNLKYCKFACSLPFIHIRNLQLLFSSFRWKLWVVLLIVLFFLFCCSIFYLFLYWKKHI